MAKPVFTHTGILSGDARQGGRKVRVRLRLTPSGSHWVTPQKWRFGKNGGGKVGEKWPMWRLHADTIVEAADA